MQKSFSPWADRIIWRSSGVTRLRGELRKKEPLVTLLMWISSLSRRARMLSSNTAMVFLRSVTYTSQPFDLECFQRPHQLKVSKAQTTSTQNVANHSQAITAIQNAAKRCKDIDIRSAECMSQPFRLMPNARTSLSGLQNTCYNHSECYSGL